MTPELTKGFLEKVASPISIQVLKYSWIIFHNVYGLCEV